MTIGIFGLEVKLFDQRLAQAAVQYHVSYRWEDPRLAGWAEEAAIPPDLWTPELMVFGNGSANESLGMATWAERGTLGFAKDGRSRGPC